MTSKLIYYVYAYVRQSDGTPYYIGKGKGKRAYAKHSFVSVPKDKSKIVFLETNLSEVGALALERRYIRWWGRKDNNTGNLLNLTDGGEGWCGNKHSDSSREKMSQKKVGLTTWLGKKHSDSSREKMRQKKIGFKPWNSGKSGIYSQETLDKMREKKLGLMETYKWWNNGVKNTRSPQCPGENWTLGRYKK